LGLWWWPSVAGGLVCLLWLWLVWCALVWCVSAGTWGVPCGVWPACGWGGVVGTGEERGTHHVPCPVGGQCVGGC
jgi:hypothetical protein